MIFREGGPGELELRMRSGTIWVEKEGDIFFFFFLNGETFA